MARQEVMSVQRLLKYAFGCGSLLMVVFLTGCGGSTSAPSSQTPPPQPQQQTGCATPATSNPAGGGGIYSQIQIDPAVYGTADTSNLTVFGFSQQNENLPADPQVMEMVPNIVSRAWQRWDTGGVQASD